MNPWVYASIGLLIFFVVLAIGMAAFLFSVKGLVDQSKQDVSLILKAVEESVHGVKDMTHDIGGKLKMSNRFFEIMDHIGTGLKTPAAILSQFMEAASVEAGAVIYGFIEGVKAFYRNGQPERRARKKEQKKSPPLASH